MHLAKEPRSERRQWIAVKAFAIAVLIGAILLMTPLASADGSWTNPVDALFTATSAVCVTGLAVVDTGGHFSIFGQGVIIFLIQIGGIGIMTLATFLLVAVGRRLSVRDEFVLMDSLGHKGVQGLRSLLVLTIVFTITLESLGAIIIAHRLFAAYDYPLVKAAYYGLFHAISGFCNAGFALYSDSMASFRSDPVIILTETVLIFLGGIGFLVLYNLSSIRFWSHNKMTRGRLTLHSRIVLGSSFALIATAFLFFAALEWNHSMVDFPWPTKLLCSLFQAVTPRTAGFSVIDTSLMRPDTQLLTMVMMFIGGSPASTAGGIKTTTLAVLATTAISMIQGRDDTVMFNKNIPTKVVREAIVIFLLATSCIVLLFGILLMTEHGLLMNGRTAMDLLFETISAFATVGLSTGITPALSTLGKLCIAICMFVGRLGPLTIALIIGVTETTIQIRYPQEEAVVG